jgi:hypothetical protein
MLQLSQATQHHPHITSTQGTLPLLPLLLLL